MTSIGVGIVGLGWIAEDAHLPTIQATEGLELTALMDITASRREHFARQTTCRMYEHLDDLLEDSAVQLVVIATPPKFHHEHALAALRAGKHVLVEKPMATTLGEAREMAAEARSRDLLLTVHHNRRFDGDYAIVRRFLDRGRLGRLITFERHLHIPYETIRGWVAQDYRPGWRLERAYGGGSLLDLGPHFFDQALDAVPGGPEWVFARLRASDPSAEVDEYFKVVITWADGTLGEASASFLAEQPLPSWYVLGTEGTLIQPVWQQPMVFKPRDGAAEELPLPPDRWSDFYRDLAAVLHGGAELIVSLDHSLAVMELIEAAVRSDAAGAAVRLPLP